MRALPVHGFVLAGGRSSRMGRDKALVEFRGRPMVEIAVKKLREFCVEVSIAGNREDLSAYAPVVRETRVDVGPAAGIEAGLRACAQEWAMFVPVDVPLVPAELLRRWAEEAMRVKMTVSYLEVNGRRQPAFCVLRKECLAGVTAALERGERRLEAVLASAEEADPVWMCDAARFMKGREAGVVERWFANVNTAGELAEAEVWAGFANADPLRG